MDFTFQTQTSENYIWCSNIESKSPLQRHSLIMLFYTLADMEEYNRKVKEALEKAEQKRQELIRQRDEEVARKRVEMERWVEEEYERRKAEAKSKQEAEIQARKLSESFFFLYSISY